MNILIPHKWLLEQLDTKATPEEIQEAVSLCGPSFENIYDREGDRVYDIEVTTNRVDSMSIRGIARESAVILSQFGIKAKLKPLEISVSKDVRPESKTEELPLPKIINDPKLSKRLMCVILKDTQRTPTPDWMAERLTQIEMNVHDSVIDITNYVTHELGHPCHAFDYDKLMATGGEIHVTEAEKGEGFGTLDGETFETVGGEVVFKNGDGEIIDLPSIKGTANTSIDDSTKNVLLLMESIMAPKVRFASMTHAIRTVAAQLMEKNLDPNLGEPTILRGIELYKELCHAKVASEIFDEFPGKKEPKEVIVTLGRIQEYLGIELKQKTIITIMEDLGCTANISGKTLIVIPPTYRPDIAIPVDIIEEIARIYGYHNLPSVVMPTAIPLAKPEHDNFFVEDKIKHYMADIGWQEIYSYSMVSEAIALESGYKLEDHLKLNNPLTDDRVYMRRSLIPSLQEIIRDNTQQKIMSVFEMAKVYHPKNDSLPNEEMRLTLVSSKSYRKVKGDLESLLGKLFITDFYIDKKGNITVSSKDSVSQNSTNKDGNTITIGIATILTNGNTAIDINLRKLLSVSGTHPAYEDIPTTSSIIEDLTFTLPEKTAIGELIRNIEENKYVHNVELKDVYKQNHTFTITYWSSEKNLSNEDITPVRKSVVSGVEKRFGAKLVGELQDKKTAKCPVGTQQEVVKKKTKYPLDIKTEKQDFKPKTKTTTKLFYMEENNLLEHNAKILELSTHNDQFIIILNETILYAQGGGQPSDTGYIESETGKFKVSKVTFNNGIVYHIGQFVEGSFSENSEVTIFVDKEKRKLHSKIHSAGHLVDSGIKKIGLNNLTPTKGYHFIDGAYVEYTGDISSLNIDETIKNLETTLNQMIIEGFETQIKTVTKDELKQLCDNVPDYLPEGKPIRAVLVWGNDWIPCGGTHVTNISEIGAITIRKIKSKKGKIKVSYSIHSTHGIIK